MTRSGRHRVALKQLGLALVATALTLGAAELAARWLLPAPRYHDAPVELDAELGFRGMADYREVARDRAGEFEFALNAAGWRGSDWDPASGAGELVRLAFFGDSFLVGRGLRAEGLLPHRTVAALGERGVAAEAFNFSVIDYGTAQQLMLFRQVVDDLQPDAVVLAFYVGNDIVNNEAALAGRTDVSAGDTIRPYLEAPDFGRAHFLHPLRATLRSVSRLFATLERRALVLAKRPGFAWLRPFPVPDDQNTRQRARRAPREGLEVLRAHAAGSPWEQGWQRTLGLLSAFRREAEAAGARFLVLVIPLEEQVQRGAKIVAFDWASQRLAGVGLDTVLDWNLPERRLAAFFAASEMDSRLLAPALREHAARGDTPYARDRHLNPLGHQVAAAEVTQWWLGEAAGVSEVSGAPALWVPAAHDAPTALDFRTHDHARFLGDGWLEWRAEPASGTSSEAGGWRIGPRALAVLPDVAGTAVLRGTAGASVAVPFVVVLEVAGQRPKLVRVAAPGRFEIRLPRIPRKQRSSNGYSVFLVGQHAGRDADVRIQGLFVEPALRAHGSAD